MNNINANAESYINSLDTYIDVMKGETTKLSDMIAKLNDKIQEVEAKKEQFIKEQNEPKFEKVSHGEPYFYIYGNNMKVAVASEDSDYTSEMCYINNNYFYTKKRAQEVTNKIKFLLELERLHDIYCPDYKAEDDGNDKYRIVFCDGMYQWEQDDYTIDFLSVYFPTEEIAQKVCDVLNREK